MRDSVDNSTKKHIDANTVMWAHHLSIVTAYLMCMRYVWHLGQPTHTPPPSPTPNSKNREQKPRTKTFLHVRQVSKTQIKVESSKTRIDWEHVWIDKHPNVVRSRAWTSTVVEIWQHTASALECSNGGPQDYRLNEPSTKRRTSLHYLPLNIYALPKNKKPNWEMRIQRPDTLGAQGKNSGKNQEPKLN